ncbi:MAG: macro domain-containing protein, partial [Treponema sp.]|nr:macro domain-containing protein [Treponema sp.]
MKLKLFLRDRSEDMARAWSAEFAGYSDVDISCGNIFEISADAIISPANSFGFMDGGIDLVYSYHFGWDLQKRLQEKIRGSFYGELPVGMAIIIETYHDKIKYLISCPTMRVPEIVSDTVNAYLAFRAGLIEIIRFNENQGAKIASLLCPGLGTKTGGIAPENCA